MTLGKIVLCLLICPVDMNMALPSLPGAEVRREWGDRGHVLSTGPGTEVSECRWHFQLLFTKDPPRPRVRDIAGVVPAPEGLP